MSFDMLDCKIYPFNGWFWRLRCCNTWSLLGSYPPKSTGCGIGQPGSSHHRDHAIFCLQTPYEAEKMAKSSGFTYSNLYVFSFLSLNQYWRRFPFWLSKVAHPKLGSNADHRSKCFEKHVFFRSNLEFLPPKYRHSSFREKSRIP